MLTVRKSSERGAADHGWLQSRFSFSFAEYHDPAHMGFGPLRVINDDHIAPGQGFGTHGHRDMEIITYVLEGAVAHKDSLGSAGEIVPGEVQRMSAGRGILHSEFNPRSDQRTHMLQIWIQPDRLGSAPSYEQRAFSDADKRGRLRLIAAPTAEAAAAGAVGIQQDARVYAGLFDGVESATHALAQGRLGYVHVARGSVTVNGVALEAGDALKLESEAEVRLEGGVSAEVLLFDLPR